MFYRIFLPIIFLAISLSAFDFKRMSAEYKVKYGIFGTIGEGKCTIDIEDGTYKIEVVASGEGLVKFVSRDRVETYKSTGVIKDGKLLPTLFVKDRKWGDKEVRKRYFFDHKNQVVNLIITKVNGGKVEEMRDRLRYYSQNDILTLFFNLRYLIGDNLETNGKIFHAVGARKKDGLITIKTLKGEEKEEIAKLLHANNRILKVVLHQKIFSSRKGEFYIDIDDRYICDRFILKDVLLYGDLYGKLKDSEIMR